MRPVAVATLGLLGLALLLRGGVAPGSAALLAVAAGGLGLLAASRRALRAPRGALALGLLAAGLAAAQLVWARELDAALDGAAAWCAAVVVFLVAASGIDRREARRWLLALVTLGAAVGALALAGAPAGGRAAFPLGNPNHLGGWLLLPGLAALGGALARDPDLARRPIAWFSGAVPVATGLAVAGSRGAFVAVLAASGLLLALRRRGSLRGAVALCAAVLALCAAAIGIASARHPEWLPAARAGSESSAGLRWQLYGASARAGLVAAPWGVGLGGFAAAFEAARPAQLRYAPRFAHSEPLHAWVELGVPFLLLCAAALALVVRRAGRAPAGPRNGAALASGVAVAAAGVHALFEFNLHVPAIALTTAALSGLAWGASAGGERRACAVATRAAIAASSAAVLALGASSALAEHHARAAQRALVAGEFAVAERRAAAGLRARPRRVALWRLRAEAAERRGDAGGEGLPALARALAARRAAVAAAPWRSALHAELAELHARRREPERALAALERAAALDPRNPGIPLRRARWLLESGRRAEAAHTLSAALARDARFARPALEALLAATGDPELVRAATPALADAALGAGQALARGGHPGAAARQFERVLAEQPGHAGAAVAAARSLRAAGQSERATRLLARALRHAADPEPLRGELARLRAQRRREGVAARDAAGAPEGNAS